MTNMDDFDLDNMALEEEPQSEESGNRTFLLVAGILGAILILSLVLIAVYAMVFLPRSREASSTEAAEINAQNTEVAMLITMTADAKSWTATPSITATKAPQPSKTPVLAPTDEPDESGGGAATVDPRTATVAALFTQQAENALTTTPVSTALPETGFMDNAVAPGLIAMAAALILVIFLARRLRTVG